MRTCYRTGVFGLLVVLTPGGSAQEPKPADPKALVRGRAFAEAGRVDLFVASSAAWGLPADDDRNWNPALKLGVALAREGGLKEWPPNDMPKAFLSMAEYRAEKREPKLVFKRQDTPYQLPDMLADGTKALYGSRAILAPGVTSPNIYGSIILSRGEVKTRRNPLGWSVVFATGDVTVAGNLSLSIVVCDGDVTVGGGIIGGLVVARGKIHAKSATDGCVVAAGGKVQLEKPSPVDPETPNTVTENSAIPFGFVKFFELSRVGVTVSVEDKVVRVTDLAAPKAFALAGVEEGDVVEGVNGKKPESAESLRRLLRDALAVGDAAVAVRRGDATHTLKVTLPE